MERRDLIQKSLEKKYGLEPEMSDNDYYTVRKESIRIMYRQLKSLSSLCLTVIFWMKIPCCYWLELTCKNQEGWSLSEELLELI